MIYQGEILGGTYQVIKQIGRGGSGLVFLAYHRNLRKYVVIKRVQMGVGNLEALRADGNIFLSQKLGQQLLNVFHDIPPY